jgi:hypothetical protein
MKTNDLFIFRYGSLYNPLRVKNVILWDVMPLGLVKFTDVSEEYIAAFFTVEE